MSSLRICLWLSSGIDPAYIPTELCGPHSFSVLADLVPVPILEYLPSTMGYGPRLHSNEGTDAITRPLVPPSICMSLANVGLMSVSVDSALGLFGTVKRLHSSE